MLGAKLRTPFDIVGPGFVKEKEMLQLPLWPLLASSRFRTFAISPR
jgi:hypothetical protein